jgi:hypothetical protein
MATRGFLGGPGLPAPASRAPRHAAGDAAQTGDGFSPGTVVTFALAGFFRRSQSPDRERKLVLPVRFQNDRTLFREDDDILGKQAV